MIGKSRIIYTVTHYYKNEIFNCSPHGAELLKMHGEITHALRPMVTFIPTITLNGSQGRQASILKDLLSEVCKLTGSHPDVCQ